MSIHITSKDLKQIFNNLKASAKKRNIPFALTISDLNELSIPLTCPVLGIPVYFNTGQVNDNSISFDRINNDIGYIPGNIIAISYRANRLKSDATLQELQSICEFYTEINRLDQEVLDHHNLRTDDPV